MRYKTICCPWKRRISGHMLLWVFFLYLRSLNISHFICNTLYIILLSNLVILNFVILISFWSCLCLPFWCWKTTQKIIHLCEKQKNLRVIFRGLKLAAAEINSREIEVAFKYIRVFARLLHLHAYIINTFCLLRAGLNKSARESIIWFTLQEAAEKWKIFAQQ